MTAEEKILDNGYEDVVVFSGDSYDDALIGVTSDNRAVYDYDKMVRWLMERDGISEVEAIEWIDYNTIGSLGFVGSPIIVYPLMED